MKISFFGAARGVTGSNHLIEIGGLKVLLDCGLFQGGAEQESKNFEPFPYNPAEIDYLILGHAHIDHSGRIPKLVKDGFRGKIISTKATMDLSRIMLADSAKIQETDTEWENRKRLRAGKELIEPLYTLEDAEKCMVFFEPYYYGQLIQLNENLSIRFNDAGHILGSSITEIWLREEEKEVKLVYAVDVGMPNRPILNDPTFIETADYVIIESTYGDRNHEEFETSSNRLIEVIKQVTKNGGTVIIPVFAVGRTQELIYQFNNYFEYDPSASELKEIPFYVDSPLAVQATEAFVQNSDSFDENTKELILRGDHPFEFDNLKYIRSVEESVNLNISKHPKVIISSSGMANAGRVRHHLKHNIWDPRNAVIFVGFQAEGTLGRILVDGVKDVKILGEEISVKASIYSINGFSSHADQNFLLEWMGHLKKTPKNVFIVHGEEPASKAFASLLTHLYGMPTVVPKPGMSFELKPGEKVSVLNEETDEEVRKSVNSEIQTVREQFVTLEERLDAKTMTSEEYVHLRNKLIEMQHLLMGLNMDSVSRTEEEG